MFKFTSLIMFLAFVPTACKTTDSSVLRDNQGAPTGVQNPAAVACANAGAQLIPVTSDAGQDSWCRFGQRSDINQWTFYKKATAKAVKAYLKHKPFAQVPHNPNGPVGMANPASTYCAQVGGIEETLKSGNQDLDACIFSDKSQIEIWTLMRGPNHSENRALTLALRGTQIVTPVAPVTPAPVVTGTTIREKIAGADADQMVAALLGRGIIPTAGITKTVKTAKVWCHASEQSPDNPRCSADLTPGDAVLVDIDNSKNLFRILKSKNAIKLIQRPAGRSYSGEVKNVECIEQAVQDTYKCEFDVKL